MLTCTSPTLKFCYPSYARQVHHFKLERKLEIMAVCVQQLFVIFWTVILYNNDIYAQVLTPPYFNLAVGRRITATSTCGTGVSEAELFCKLTGANPGNPGLDPHYTVIRYVHV